MFVREKRISGYTYLYLVESVREQGRAKQRIIKNLGRKEAVVASGELGRLAGSVARYAERAVALSQPAAAGNPEGLACTRIGAPLLFGRLREETGCKAVVEGLLAGRGFEFAVERAVFATVLHRLMVSGSDRACERWLGDYAIPGVDGGGGLARCTSSTARWPGWARSCPPTSSSGARPPSPPPRAHDGQGPGRGGAVRAPARPVRRTLGGVPGHHDPELHRRGRRGPGRARLLEGPPPRPDADGRGRRGRRRGPPGLLGAVARQHGGRQRARAHRRPPARPLRHRPGLRGGRPRHDLGRRCRRPRGARARERGLEYVLGARERTDALVRTVVLADSRPFTPLCVRRGGGGEQTQLWVKECKVEGRRHIVCRNEAEAEKDAADRRAIIEALDRQLKRGDKALVGNSAYRRYLRRTGQGRAFEIDPGKLADGARYDGVFVLRANAARLTPLQAVLRYRDLMQVEQLFRAAKALLRTRPIYHSSDAAIRGHVFCSFLALVLRKELDRRRRAAGLRPEWGDVVRDLDRLQEVTTSKGGQSMTLRTPAAGVVGPVVGPLFKAARVARPPNVRDEAAATSPT